MVPCKFITGQGGWRGAIFPAGVVVGNVIMAAGAVDALESSRYSFLNSLVSLLL